MGICFGQIDRSKDGAAIPGATSGDLLLSGVALTAAGDYSLFLSNSAGTATSRLAHLTVTAPPMPPSISVQPQSRVAALGSNVVFNFVGTGTAPLYYQWQFNKKPLAGAPRFTSVAAAASGNCDSVARSARG